MFNCRSQCYELYTFSFFLFYFVRIILFRVFRFFFIVEESLHTLCTAVCVYVDVNV